MQLGEPSGSPSDGRTVLKPVVRCRRRDGRPGGTHANDWYCYRAGVGGQPRLRPSAAVEAGVETRGEADGNARTGDARYLLSKRQPDLRRSAARSWSAEETQRGTGHVGHQHLRDHVLWLGSGRECRRRTGGRRRSHPRTWTSVSERKTGAAATGGLPEV